MAEGTLLKLYNEAKDGIPDWDKLSESDKGSFICLKLLCKDCPLDYKDEKGMCKGRSKIYTYLDSLNLAYSLDKDIRRLREDKKSADKDQVTDFNLRIGSLTRLQNSYTNRCNEITKSLSFGDLNPEKMKPIEVPVSPDPEPIPEPKKKSRVWTEEQIERAKETRRKTWEAKKKQESMLKATEKSEATKVKEPEPEMIIVQGQRLEVVIAIINKRLEIIDEKIKGLTEKIKSLEEEGVMVDYVLPDLGRDQLIRDQEYLVHAQELVNQYLEIKQTSDPDG